MFSKHMGSPGMMAEAPHFKTTELFQHLTGMAAVFLQLSRLANSVTVNAPSVWALVALKWPG